MDEDVNMCVNNKNNKNNFKTYQNFSAQTNLLIIIYICQRVLTL